MVIAQWVVRHRLAVLLSWLALTAALAVPARRAERALDAVARVRGSEAVAVERALAERFGSPFARNALLVATGVPSPATDGGAAVLDTLVRRVMALPGVSGTLSFRDVADTMLLGRGGRGAIVLVGLAPSDNRLDAMVPTLRLASAGAARALRARYPSVSVRWTGEVLINYDLRRTSTDEVAKAETRVFPLTFLLLLLAFGALAAALLPLGAGAIAISCALGLAVLINAVWPLSILLQSTVSMIGLGVGIDYALLTVSRYREARAGGLDPHAAAVEAGAHGGHTIALSGVAVMIGFAALLLVPLNELQSTGVGGIIVVALSVLMATTLLPALLALLGPRLDWGSIARRTASARGRDAHGARWRAWGRLVVRHPWLVLVVSATPLVALAWQARRLNPEVPRGQWLPASMESARAMDDLAAIGRGGLVNSMRVILALPADVPATSARGLDAIRQLTDRLALDHRVARASSLATAGPVGRLPPSVRALLVSADERLATIELIPRDSVDFGALTDLARDIRRLDVAAVSGVAGASAQVGGMAAFNADYVAAIDARAWRVVGLVLAGTFLALVIGFKSVLVPVKALALNLLSVGAAFGAVVIVCQEGHGARWLGLAGPLGGVFPAVPLTVFCIVFGLSLDYEVFLVARVAEARAHMDHAAAIVEGLAHTGGVITSAALIMIAVFGAFAIGDFVFVKVLGFALAVAVLIDATLVRVAIAPALLLLAGEWNWWPGPRPRRDGATSADGR